MKFYLLSALYQVEEFNHFPRILFPTLRGLPPSLLEKELLTLEEISLGQRKASFAICANLLVVMAMCNFPKQGQ